MSNLQNGQVKWKPGVRILMGCKTCGHGYGSLRHAYACKIPKASEQPCKCETPRGSCADRFGVVHCNWCHGQLSEQCMNIQSTYHEENSTIRCRLPLNHIGDCIYQ